MSLNYDAELGQLILRCEDIEKSNEIVATLSFGHPNSKQEMIDFLEGETGFLMLKIYDASKSNLIRMNENTYKLIAGTGGFMYTLTMDSAVMDEILVQSWDSYEKSYFTSGTISQKLFIDK